MELLSVPANLEAINTILTRAKPPLPPFDEMDKEVII